MEMNQKVVQTILLIMYKPIHTTLKKEFIKLNIRTKVLTGVSSEQNGGQTFIFADEQESDEQLFCFEKLEQDKYKIVQQSSQKVLTAQDNTAVFRLE